MTIERPEMSGSEKEEKWERFNEILVGGKFEGVLNLRPTSERDESRPGYWKNELILSINSGDYGFIFEKGKKPIEKIPQRSDTEDFAKLYYKLEDDFVKKGVLEKPEIGNDAPTLRSFFWKNRKNPPALKDFVAALREGGIEVEKK